MEYGVFPSRNKASRSALRAGPRPVIFPSTAKEANVASMADPRVTLAKAMSRYTPPLAISSRHWDDSGANGVRSMTCKPMLAGVLKNGTTTFRIGVLNVCCSCFKAGGKSAVNVPFCANNVATSSRSRGGFWNRFKTSASDFAIASASGIPESMASLYTDLPRRVI